MAQLLLDAEYSGAWNRKSTGWTAPCQLRQTLFPDYSPAAAADDAGVNALQVHKDKRPSPAKGEGRKRRWC